MSAPSPDDHAHAASVALAERVLANNYGPAPLTFSGSDGVYLLSTDGERYLDFGSGISVTSFGQGHPQVREAVLRQLDGIWHTSNLYYTPPALALAQTLIDHSFATRVFFSNSGAEANEAAIKLVRKAASATRPPEQRTILTFHGGFHGRTLTTVTATAQPKYQLGFEPLPPGFRYCPFNDVAALEAAFDHSVCAVMFEPVQGEGGIHVAEPAFVAAVQRLAQQHDAWVIVDEVQSGVSRTGKLWAHQWYPAFAPDVMTSAKALGGGLPIGATLIGERLQSVFQPGSHGSTFGGNPVCCAGARAVLDLASEPQLQLRVQQLGDQIVEGLAALNERMTVFGEVRGRGLMLGAPLLPHYRAHIGALVAACREERLLVLQAGDGVLRLLPPLTITPDDVRQMLDRLWRALQRVPFDAKEAP